MGGQVDISCLEAAQTMQQFRAGMVKVFGVLANKRWAGAPDVPTLAEGGLPGHQIEFWHGLWAPKGTPKDIVAKLNTAVSAAFTDPAVRKRFMDLGHEIPAQEHAITAGAVRPSQGRARPMVAADQGGRHQGAVSSTAASVRQPDL